MAHIKIITDSASDIPQYLLDKYDISFLPICVVMNGKVYKDRYDLDGREYLKTLPDMEEIPTTSMVPMEIIENEFRKNLDEYDAQVFVTMSSKGSGGYNAANLIKDKIEDETGKKTNITVIDSMLYSMLFGKAVVAMAQKAREGAELNEILDVYEAFTKNARAYFMVDDLKHLQKGGRIKSGTALVGSLLGIKPILTINDGLVEAIGKERGKQRAINKIADLAVNDYDTELKSKIWIANGYADEGCNEVIRLLKEKLDNPPIEMFNLGCIVGTHAGSGLIGIIFDKKGE